VTTTVNVSGDCCRDFTQSSKLEWLETNGTGAFAMGTVSGANTRRYHALLTASLRPPVARRVLLSRVEEDVVIDGKTFALGASQYPGVVTPRGFELLQEFRAEPCATWVYGLNGARLEKQVYLVEGRQAVVVRYRADQPMKLHVRPFLVNRDYHSLQRAVESGGTWRGTPLLFSCSAKFTQDGHWYYNIEYLQELDRGLDFREDLYSPGFFTFEVRQGNARPGEWMTLCASIPETTADGTPGGEAPPEKRDPFLVRRADGTPAIIAGYPWFTDWGRDTMISLPGLLIAPGKLNEARELIEAHLKYLNQGLIPNRFPDSGEEPQYNSADATLWMFQAMRAWLAAGGDTAFLRDVFIKSARQIIDWHRHGTLNGISVDPSDGLLRAGEPGSQLTSQLTWMDARVGDRAVTPRHGKPVEINALWFGALRLMTAWGDHDYREESLRVQRSFREKFWNAKRQCLYDVLTDDGPVEKLRPNQIFAVSLGGGLLDREQQQSVVRIVERELLTPAGLRTLEPNDPDYKGRYTGGPAERDSAYHQGTVWPWLMGPFIDAYLEAFGRTAETVEYCRELIGRLEECLAAGPCLGSAAEIYDGDEPRSAKGCPAQAWSVAELARTKALLA